MSCKILAGNYHRYDFAFWLQFSTTRSSKQQTARYFFILFVTKNAKVSLMIYSPSPTRLHTRARSVMAFASFPWLWCCGSRRLDWLCCPLWAAVLSAGLLSRSSRAGLAGISSRDPRQQRAAGRQAPRHQLQGLRLHAGRSLFYLSTDNHTQQMSSCCVVLLSYCVKKGGCVN
jgi:hypothetical protein